MEQADFEWTLIFFHTLSSDSQYIVESLSKRLKTTQWVSCLLPLIINIKIMV